MTPHYDTHGIFDALCARRVDNIYAKFRIAIGNVIINLTYGLKMETAENVCVYVCFKYKYKFRDTICEIKEIT